MPTLNSTTKKSIEEVLDNSPFSLASFKLDYGQTGTLVFAIAYRANDNMRFNVHQRALGGLYNVEMSPGETFAREDYSYQKIKDVIDLIRPWTFHLNNELRAQSIDKEADEFWKNFQAGVESQITDEKAFFSREEKEILIQRVDKLEKELQTLFKANGATDREVADLKYTFDTVKSNVDIMPQGTWYRMVAGKIASFLKKFTNTKIGQALLTETVKEGVKGVLNSEFVDHVKKLVE